MPKLYTFIHEDLEICVPIPEMTEDQKQENIKNYGNEYGVMWIRIEDRDNNIVHMISSSKIRIIEV